MTAALSRRALAAAIPALALTRRARAQSGPLRFAVGPFQPTAGDTRRAYEPFFSYLAKTLDRPFELTVTTDWAGIAVALANDQVDCAWMGPWGYVLARGRAGAEALAVVEYQGKPTYQAIIIARPELKIERFPEDAKGMSISFADAGSTSGWLIPHHWFQTQGIDPRTYFRYTDGASHPANDIAVASGQVDLATDYDRNLAAMIAAGRVKPDQVRIVWRSAPLPNDALAVRRGLDPAVKAAILKAALAVDAETAPKVMPANYTGQTLSAVLYVWEFNIRASTVLGLVGAGGLGQELKNAVDLLDFGRVAAILGIIVTLVLTADRLSARARASLL